MANTFRHGAKGQEMPNCFQTQCNDNPRLCHFTLHVGTNRCAVVVKVKMRANFLAHGSAADLEPGDERMIRQRATRNSSSLGSNTGNNVRVD